MNFTQKKYYLIDIKNINLYQRISLCSTFISHLSQI